MRTDAAPRDYARAIIEDGMHDWDAELARARDALRRASLMSQLNDPSLEFARKEELIREALPPDLSQPVANLVLLLASRADVGQLDGIIQEVRRIGHAEAGIVVAYITTAVSLTQGEQQSLHAALEQRFGALRLETTIDPSILGGVVVRVGDVVIDGSVAAKLSALREELKRAG